jgi:hypothetical protein
MDGRTDEQTDGWADKQTFRQADIQLRKGSLLLRKYLIKKYKNNILKLLLILICFFFFAVSD